MSNLDIKLSQVEQVKADIKQALIDKKVDMTSVPFTEYASKIGEISGGISQDNINYLFSSVTGASTSVTIDSSKKVIAILGFQNAYDFIADGKSSIKFTVNGTEYTCATTNGLYEKRIVNNGTKDTVSHIWINNGQYKDSAFTKASFTNGWGDGGCHLYVIYA